MEDQIVDRLQASVPVPSAPTSPEASITSTDEQSSFVSNAVSELVLLRLGNALGVVNATPESTQQLKFVYEQIAGESPSTSYEAVQNTLEEYMTRLGLTFREDRFMRLYLWLKLNRERFLVNKEMSAVLGEAQV